MPSRWACDRRATTLLAVVFLDRGRAGGLVAGILIVMYLANVIAQLSPDLEGSASLSLFHYFDLKPLIDTGPTPWPTRALPGRRDRRLAAGPGARSVGRTS